jgi:hypothetical protein
MTTNTDENMDQKTEETLLMKLVICWDFYFPQSEHSERQFELPKSSGDLMVSP